MTIFDIIILIVDDLVFISFCTHILKMNIMFKYTEK